MRTSIGQAFTCRSWVQEALFAMNEEGYVDLGGCVRGIGEEAQYLGIMYKKRCQRGIVRGRYYPNSIVFLDGINTIFPSLGVLV